VFNEGTAACWGKNEVGGLGNGNRVDSLVPVTLKLDPGKGAIFQQEGNIEESPEFISFSTVNGLDVIGCRFLHTITGWVEFCRHYFI
jgi:hypothetical protein